jgi:hypothetical protein
MATDRDDQADELSDAQLEEWYRLHNGRENGEPAGIGIQARDRTIRRLIEEVRRLRARGATKAQA